MVNIRILGEGEAKQVSKGNRMSDPNVFAYSQMPPEVGIQIDLKEK